MHRLYEVLVRQRRKLATAHDRANLIGSTLERNVKSTMSLFAL